MKIDKLGEMIKDCNNIVFFGGAGVSTESGVKDYRSKDGLYNTVRDYGVSPEEILSHSFFTQNPEIFYDFYRKYFVIDAKPNEAHKALARLEKMGKLKAVITQNIDNLHQKAGSENVIELHGNTREFYCDECGLEAKTNVVMQQIMSGEVPKCNSCKGVIRPRVVMYEEMLHKDVPERAIGYIENADLLIVGGTSLVVNPAASFVKYFRGKYFVIINKLETPYDDAADLVIRENIGEVFEKVMEIIN